MKKLIFIIILCSSTLFAQAQSAEDSTLFDFWVGKWNATWDDGDGKLGRGTNEILKTLDGKVLQENFRITEGQSKGFKGTSISVFNPNTKVWKQAWADNQGGYFDFTGAVDSKGKVFKTAGKKGKDGKVIVQRMVFYDITKDSMTWDWESTNDGGKTWNLQWRINYEKQ